MNETLLSIAWLTTMAFAVQGCPEDMNDRDLKMYIAYLFFGFGPVIVYFLVKG